MTSRAQQVRMAALLLLAALLVSCASTPRALELHGDGLGSTWTVKLAGPVHVDGQTLHQGIQTQIDALTHQLSRWDSTSAISTVNASTEDTWHPLPPQLNEALAYALDLAASTGGAYDPTVGPLVDAWGFGTQGRRYAPPNAEAISAARQRVGWAKITLDTATRRMRKAPGVQIDLSSMTHGLAADQVAAYLRSVGVTRYFVDVGSELRAQGDAPQGQPWRVAIERPPPEMSPSRAQVATTRVPTDADTAAAPLHVINLRDAGIATSGNYRYFFDYNGRRYSHRIDPRTGEPITYPLAAVTVIHPECMKADALATALTVLGPDEGLDYAQRNGIAALFIIRTEHGLEERMTMAFKSRLD
jgi:thiamine biosynthesis lipoprotein